MDANLSSLERPVGPPPNAVLAQKLARLVLDWAPRPGKHNSPLEGVELYRADSFSNCTPAICEPSLCFIIQGTKSVRFGDREIIYEPLTYLASNVHLPVLGKVVQATPEQPYLAAKLRMDPREITELLLESGNQVPQWQQEQECPEVCCGLCMSPMDENMQLAVARLLSLMDSPSDVPVLAPLARREILYRALVGDIGPQIRKFVTSDSQANRISRVIATLKDRYAQPLRIGELATAANMSESALFHTFKKVTRMSPLQFQKKLRLQEARRLMLTEGIEAAAASYRVGYESPSQFSREYSRMFGAPPRADVVKLRGASEQAFTM